MSKNTRLTVKVSFHSSDGKLKGEEHNIWVEDVRSVSWIRKHRRAILERLAGSFGLADLDLGEK